MRFIFLFLLIFHYQVKAELLTRDAKVSILTCSPGNMLHSHFGHSAIRVIDPVKKIDYVFNYGTFDFTTRGFYWKFCKGKLNYFLSVTIFDRFMYTYVAENRSVYEQVLNLQYAEKLKIYDALLENFKPNNRYYLYSFLDDNCSTRVRDILANNLYEKIQYNYIKSNKKQSFLTLINQYLENSPWMRLGISIILGAPANKISTDFEKMFLPDYIKYSFDGATYKQNNLSQPITTIYKTKEISQSFPWYFTPTFLFLALLGVIIILKIFRKYSSYLDISILFFVGLCGIIITFFWFFTDHSATKWNYNILWALPTHFIGSILLFFKKNWNWLRIYFKISLLLVLIFIVINFRIIELGFYFFLVILLVSILNFSYANFVEKNNRQIV